MSGKKNGVRTQTIEDNCNPQFYQTLEMEYEVRDIKDPESYPPFLFDVYDEDNDFMDTTDDFLGRCQIEPEVCQAGGSLVLQSEFEKDKSKEIPMTPQWHKFYF